MVWDFMKPDGPQLYAKQVRAKHNTFQVYRTKHNASEVEQQQKIERRNRGEPDPDYPLPVPGPRRDRIQKQAQQEPWQRKKWAAYDMVRATANQADQARQLEAGWRLNPRYKRKRLGIGGQGITERFTADQGEPGDHLIPVKEFVMKAPLIGSELSLVQERNTMKVSRDIFLPPPPQQLTFFGAETRRSRAYCPADEP